MWNSAVQVNDFKIRYVSRDLVVRGFVLRKIFIRAY